MSRNQRLGLVGLALVIAAVAFVLARPSDDGEEETRGVATAPSTATVTETQERPPKVTRVRVEGGQPVGGVNQVHVRKGETVRLRFSSSDTSDEIHVHGYDLSEEMAPGRPVSFTFEARIEGVFEIELEGAHHQLASLVIEPS